MILFYPLKICCLATYSPDKNYMYIYNAENLQRKLSNVDSAFCACFRWLTGILCTDRTHHLKRRSLAGSRGYSKCQPLSILRHWMFMPYADKEILVLLSLMKWHFTRNADDHLWILQVSAPLNITSLNVYALYRITKSGAAFFRWGNANCRLLVMSFENFWIFLLHYVPVSFFFL